MAGSAASLRRVAAAVAAALRRDGGGALFCLIAAAAVVLDLRRRRRRRRRGLPPLPLKHHPLVAWAVENGLIAASGALLLLAAPRPPPGAGRLAMFRHALAHEILGTALTVCLLTVNRDVLYRDVAAFPGGSRPAGFHESLDGARDFARVGLPFTVAAAAVNSRRSPAAEPLALLAGFSPARFLAKLLVMRLSVDVGFYAGHRAIHHPALYWIHRRHHEHRHPGLATNYHFSHLDLFIEALVPVFLGMGVLRALGMRLTRLEEALALNGYIAWHLGGSHCSKPLPTATFFPPLAPLYQLALGDVDVGNVRHHDLHHRLLKCNYGISVWPDVVMGTRRADDSDPPPA